MKRGKNNLLPSFCLAAAFACGCGESTADSAEALGEHINLVATSPTHSCAVRQAGLYCWGQNIAGELGTGDKMPSTTPALATVAGADIVEVATNAARTCVRRKSGEMACWGVNEQGQIGDGTRTASLTPVAASGVNDALAMAIDEPGNVGTSCRPCSRPWARNRSPSARKSRFAISSSAVFAFAHCEKTAAWHAWTQQK